MRSIVLKNELDLLEFQKYCAEFLHIDYPLECLQRSKVRAFIKNEKIVGGFILTLKPPFRVLESLPEAVKATHAAFKRETLENSMEVTGLWLNPMVRGKRENFKFWMQLYTDLSFSNKKYLFYAYGLDKKHLQKIYSLMNPTVIYRGATKVMPGMQYAENESVEMASINYVRFSLFHRGDFIFKKLLLSRDKSNRYFHSLGLSFSKRMGRLKNVPKEVTESISIETNLQ
jgi:hypothetical protein